MVRLGRRFTSNPLFGSCARARSERAAPCDKCLLHSAILLFLFTFACAPDPYEGTKHAPGYSGDGGGSDGGGSDGDGSDGGGGDGGISGSLDTGFGTEGIVTTGIGDHSTAFSLAIQSDDKIVVAGDSYNGSFDSDFALARYDTNGTLDMSFGGDGVVTTAISADFDHAYAIAIQPDGRILLAGAGSLLGNYDFALARYLPDGSLDTSFGTDGVVTTAIGSSEDIAHSVAIQGDGGIVVAGSSVNGANDRNFALVRYNADGSLDTSFGGDGVVTTAFGSDDQIAYSVAIQPDGKIVAAGYFYNGADEDIAVARYTLNGSLDTSFDIDGKVATSISGDERAHGTAIQSDGKIAAIGYTQDESRDFVLVRYNANGGLDSGFDGDGIVRTDFESGSDTSYAVALQADNKIVLAGVRHSNPDRDFALARYDTDGSLDTSFGEDGKVVTELGSTYDELFALAMQSDGRIVTAGRWASYGRYYFALARYHP
jgi:uncharacterized delta-60 repeat protein